jgi:hypothetical protein
VALFTLRGVLAVAERLVVTRHDLSQHRTVDMLHYLIDSMRKQQLWFHNYKAREESTMGLVYNLVTQQDAANNIELAKDMKRDSTSMVAIATLTMVFLPGTFTAVCVHFLIYVHVLHTFSVSLLYLPLPSHSLIYNLS